MEALKKIKVLFIVNNQTHGGIPLELGHKILGNNSKDEKLEFRLISYNQSFFSVFDYFRFLKLGKFEIVHVHHTKSALFSLGLKPFFKYKLIITEHNDFKRYSLIKKLIKLFLYYCSKVIIANSQNTKTSIPFFFRDKIEVIYNGVDVERIKKSLDTETSTILSNSTEFIFSAIRLVPQKNVFRLIKAFRLFIENSPSDYKLIIAGNGQLMRDLQIYISSRLLNNSIILLGDIPRNDVYKYMNECSLFIMPSLFEGFCNAIIEAAIIGCKIVHSDIKTLREVTNDSFLNFNPENVNNIAIAIELGIKNQVDKDLKQVFINKFDINICLNKYKLIYYRC